MPLNIRPATEGDQPTIRRLIKEANINRMNLHWPNFVVAEDDGVIVGVGQVKAHGDGSRELASIAVVPALEGYYERFGFRRLEPAEYPPYFARMIPLINVVARLFGTQILVMRREAAL